MWQRTPERQLTVAFSKIFEALRDVGTGICVSFSGGKDSSLLLDMLCEAWVCFGFQNEPIRVVFADTTNETRAILDFIAFYIPYLENKYGVKIDFERKRPANGLTWVSFVKENGIPLISKAQAKAIRTVKRDLLKLGLDVTDAINRTAPTRENVRELYELGFSKTSVLSLTGYISYKGEFGECFKISKQWLPMLSCPVDITEQCCVKIKEKTLKSIDAPFVMTGEQASESSAREAVYLKYGCNHRFDDGRYVSKPFGAMTLQGILFGLYYRDVPICPDYGKVLFTEQCGYFCSKCNRTGCALCGFGCQYDTGRFVRLQETEPAKVRYAFTPLDQGGLGFLEAIDHMNTYCGTRVDIPEVV